MPKEDEKSDADVLGELNERKEKVQSCVSGQDHFGAIKAAVMDTPKVKSDAAKELLTECASNALEGVSSSNIQGIVDKLSSEQRSQVMKFVFKCMATGKNCANLLVWHERLVAAEGVGIIMRALVDRSI